MEGATDEPIEVLANVDRLGSDADSRRRLRLAALLHDSMKYMVDRSQPRAGENHHARLGRRMAEHYMASDAELLDVIELHDEPFDAYIMGRRSNDWPRATERAAKAVEQMRPAIDLYLAFLWCANHMGSKTVESIEWFADLARTHLGGRKLGTAATTLGRRQRSQPPSGR